MFERKSTMPVGRKPEEKRMSKYLNQSDLQFGKKEEESKKETKQEIFSQPKEEKKEEKEEKKGEKEEKKVPGKLEKPSIFQQK